MSSGKKYPYKEARFTNAKRAFVVFYAYCEARQKLKRKVIFCPRSYNHSSKERWGKQTVQHVNGLLEKGFYFKADIEELPQVQKPIPKPLILVALAEQVETKKAILRDKSGGTYATIYNKLKVFIERLKMEKYTIDAFEHQHALLFRDYLIKTCKNSNRTVNSNMIKLGGLFTMAKGRGYIEKNPFTGIAPLPETDTDANVAFSKEHQLILEEWMQKNDPVLYLFTRFIYLAFLRPKELRQLRGHHIDPTKKTITVQGHIAKNRKTQTIPINKKLHELIGVRVDYLPKKYLFGKLLTWLGDTPCSENYAYNRHKKALEATGLTDYNYTLYSWKHTGACRAIEAGVNPRKLQGLLRHSSLEETDTYLRSLGISLQNEELKEVW